MRRQEGSLKSTQNKNQIKQGPGKCKRNQPAGISPIRSDHICSQLILTGISRIVPALGGIVTAATSSTASKTSPLRNSYQEGMLFPL
jgi:hypothetical protein